MVGLDGGCGTIELDCGNGVPKGKRRVLASSGRGLVRVVLLLPIACRARVLPPCPTDETHALVCLHAGLIRRHLLGFASHVVLVGGRLGTRWLLFQTLFPFLTFPSSSFPSFLSLFFFYFVFSFFHLRSGGARPRWRMLKAWIFLTLLARNHHAAVDSVFQSAGGFMKLLEVRGQIWLWNSYDVLMPRRIGLHVSSVRGVVDCEGRCGWEVEEKGQMRAVLS